MKTNIFMSLMLTLIITAFTACNNSQKDLTPPLIDNASFLPANCDIYYQGDTILVHFLCTDDTELGNFNIEIHNNFDHHTHSTDAEDCEGEHQHEEGAEHEHEHSSEGWVCFINGAPQIPAGSTEYTADLEIPVPKDATEGDYHFMLRLTDQAGWQSLKAVSIHIEEKTVQ